VLKEELLNDCRILKVTVRTSDAQAQLYLNPNVSLKGWVTSLPESVCAQKITELCCSHATPPASNSTLSSRPAWIWSGHLPGKFDTNNLVMAFAICGYNRLRWIGL